MSSSVGQNACTHTHARTHTRARADTRTHTYARTHALTHARERIIIHLVPGGGEAGTSSLGKRTRRRRKYEKVVRYAVFRAQTMMDDRARECSARRIPHVPRRFVICYRFTSHWFDVGSTTRSPALGTTRPGDGPVSRAISRERTTGTYRNSRRRATDKPSSTVWRVFRPFPIVRKFFVVFRRYGFTFTRRDHRDVWKHNIIRNSIVFSRRGVRASSGGNCFCNWFRRGRFIVRTQNIFYRSVFAPSRRVKNRIAPPNPAHTIAVTPFWNIVRVVN